MKHIFIFILSFVPTFLFGLSTREYSINISYNKFSVNTVDGVVSITSNYSNSFLYEDTLSPALPYIFVNILISPEDEYESASINYNATLLLKDVVLASNQVSFPTSTSSNINRRDNTYKETIYPQKQIEYAGTHLMDGYKYLSFILCPFQYNVTNRELYFKNNIKITIQLNKTNEIKNISKKIGKSLKHMIREIVINESELERLYPYDNSTSNAIRPSSYDYVIITTDSLRPTFEKLAYWKTVKGVRTKVISVDECREEFPNMTTQLAIKSVLAQYYINGMKYALLGGDADIVPTQVCYLPRYTSDTYDTPCDLFYASLDKCFDWDKNGNGIYGEPKDSIDFDPEFIITRVSVSNIAETDVFVNRILEYEISPKVEGWKSKMLSCGYLLQNYINTDSIQISDANYQGEYVYRNGVQNNWSNQHFRLFDTYTDYPQGSNYQATANNLQIELAKGYTFVDEYSHGWAHKWGYLEDSTQYRLNKASNLINSGYTIITTNSCYSNAFDRISSDFANSSEPYSCCLSEAFMRNPHSGILAYFGSSREGWINYSYYFNTKFYEHLFSSNNKQFGNAAIRARTSYSALENHTIFRWLTMTLNPLGDAEMPIYLDTPKKFQNINIELIGNNLSVTTGSDSCRICISSITDNGGSYYEVIDSVTNTSFPCIENDCYLCITKQGYIPYVVRVGPNVYLQNETILKDLTIISGATHIGSDITSSKPLGPVSIIAGKTNITSNDSVIIKNNFEIGIGAEFEAKIAQ